MTRELECVQVDERGQVQPVIESLCQHAIKPPTDVVCNEDKPCGSK